jgi:hypothetical protein
LRRDTRTPHPPSTGKSVSEPAKAEHEGVEPTAHAQPVGGDAPLLYLYSNNSIRDLPDTHRTEQILALCGILAPYQKRQAHALFLNVSRLIDKAPSVGHIGFFSLTVKDNVTDKAEFSRRWNSMRSNYWNTCPHFGHWLGCFEQQKRGAWHLHILVVLPYDIRQGVNFKEFAQRRYRSASPYLRAVWRDLRGACMRYGFGRHELHPVKSNSECMARYIGKYISKHIGQREEAAKGKRLITSSRDWAKNSMKFAWNTEGAKEWRRKVRVFAHLVGCESEGDLYDKFGPGWAYNHLDTIYNIDEQASNLVLGVPF